MSFPRYEHYKDSGVEWLGEVPAHWDVAAVGHRYQVLLGKMLDERRITGNHLAPYLRNVDVQWDRINIDALPEMDFSGDEIERYGLIPGDLLVCEGGEVGRSAIWQGEHFECYYQKALHRLRQHDKNMDHPRFMFYLLRMATSRGIFEAGESKSTIAHLTAEALRRYRFGFPPQQEQVQIIAFLDRETAKLDALITEQRTLIDLLKEKRQAVISHAVTKGLDPDVAMKDSGVEWLGEVPAHWDILCLRRVIRSIEQGWSPECFARQAEGDEWGVLKAGCVNRGVFNQDENKALPVEVAPISEYEVRVGDILMSRASGSPELVGSTARVQAVQPRLMLSDKIFRIHLNSRVSPDYFVLALNSIYLREQIEQALSGGNGMASNLPQSSLLKFMVCLPQVSEQELIFERVTEEIARLDALTTEAETTIALLQERRSALISAAVTGKIDVRQAA